MSGLHIAEDLTLPMDAVTQTFGILAVRGAGKSNTAAVMAEEMFAAGLPFVAIDPVGSWWGLRSSADGASPGLPIPIFGGRHGDVPLERTNGALLADLVVEQRLSCVLDVSEFSENDKRHFLADFAERLYRRNEEPLHLYLEEADDYVPQTVRANMARLVGAWETIVRRGRARGLGITMITQRSAALNKMVLTQIETLIVLRTTSPQDRKAIEGWVEYHGQSREVLESLPGLENGEAWIWSPHWLRTLRRVRIRQRRTFDSGATPKQAKGKRPPATLADVDLAALRERLASTIERSKAEDPKELRRQLAELKARLGQIEQTNRQHQRAAEQPRVETVVERIEVPVVPDGQLQQLREWADSVSGVAMRLIDAANEVRAALVLARRENLTPPRELSEPSKTAPRVKGNPQPAQKSKLTLPTETAISEPQQRILDVLATLAGIGLTPAHRSAVAALSGYTHTSGHYQNLLGGLRSRGLVEYPVGGYVALTDAGRATAQPTATISTLQDLHDAWYRQLDGPQARVLRALIEAYPDALSREVLAERTRYAATSGHFQNILGSLRTLQLVDYPSRGLVVATALLFPEGLSAIGG